MIRPAVQLSNQSPLDRKGRCGDVSRAIGDGRHIWVAPEGGQESALRHAKRSAGEAAGQVSMPARVRRLWWRRGNAAIVEP